MGYKLAGYDVLGGVEIDPEMMAVYKANHHPKHPFLMGVGDFNKIPDKDLPAELFNLDILDGSPPCSTFSMAGSREKKWGEAHQFREGQAKQVLDDLFFQFIDTAKKLKPKVVVAENVKGLITGKARGYVKEIFSAFRGAGYEAQLFLFNAAALGVPQRRERTVFVARMPCFRPMKPIFKERTVSVRMAWSGLPKQNGSPLTARTTELWHRLKPGDAESKLLNGSCFNNFKYPIDTPAPTVTANGGKYHPLEPRNMSAAEYLRLQTFPDDYKTCGMSAAYLCGMSVPPFMMQRIADQIERQLFSQQEAKKVG